ncbi:hypothetical protein AGLY_013140 [Aphis glycines]|uniref:Uncharacterized protein n=1 Tax=Aphis glycines TaxID=307491 RepID=A0A6G0T6S3_APHGL|nr:hypothetical protein AGLY_013140 [Aphis glycines]
MNKSLSLTLFAVLFFFDILHFSFKIIFLFNLFALFLAVPPALDPITFLTNSGTCGDFLSDRGSEIRWALEPVFYVLIIVKLNLIYSLSEIYSSHFPKLVFKKLGFLNRIIIPIIPDVKEFSKYNIIKPFFTLTGFFISLSSFKRCKSVAFFTIFFTSVVLELPFSFDSELITQFNSVKSSSVKTQEHLFCFAHRPQHELRF